MRLRFLSSVLCLFLAACGSADIKDSLGLTHRAPDEFRVVARPPLSVPPEFNLMPPSTGTDNPSGAPATVTARNTVLGVNGSGTNGNAVNSASPLSNVAGGSLNLASPGGTSPITAVTPVFGSALPSSADSQFLSNAGYNHTDPQVRQKILNDTLNGVGTPDNSYLLGAKKETDSQVDAAKEAARLKQDKDQNKPPTEGETPVIAPKSNGILGDIF